MPSLPRELWIEIFLQLTSSYERPGDIDSTRALRSACLVCRGFCRLAQPVLYRTILSYPTLTNKVSTWPVKLARTLVARPDLARAVIELKISEKAFLKLKESVRPYLRKMIASSSIPPRLKSMLKDTVKSGASCSAVVSLLLLALMPRLKYLCHNLESTVGPLAWILGAEIVETGEDPWVTYTAIANHLADLEEVRWIYPRQERDSTRAVKGVLLLPRMKRLYLTNHDCIKGDSKDTWVTKGQQSNLYKATFDQCVLDGPFLKHVLSCCQNLRKLDFRLRTRLPHQEKYSLSMNLDMYGETLRDFGQNLVKLVLFNFNSSTYTIVGKIGSLQKLEHLRYLAIERKVLVGHGEYKLPIAKVLPVSLESFHCYIQIHDVGLMHQEPASELEDEIIRLVDSGRFPKLRTIEFDRCGSRREDLFTRTLEGWRTRDNFWSDMIPIYDDNRALVSLARLMHLEMNREGG